MIVFKCKMCGGEMELEEGATVAECPYCMTKQTLPKLDNDKRANMYDRANHFRRQNEYDKAMAIFENILQEDRTDAEAYWSLVLCRYGIEYVEDPATHKRVPTVNRVQYTSILADEDYKSALEYADFAQRSVYEAEAKAIDEIQKGILAISKQEKPFDVFICYKETDANGRRTPDSVLANDLYHQLTNEGFKVFFSRITLEDKIGTAYEPYIFAALNSAKVMVVLGTKPEYFNAVWVKNEWSRYLALIRAGADKTLVPAYRDMDPYDLPEEFSHLQAQDMGKLGFMQDLIRGIKKLTTTETAKPQTVVQQNVGTGTNIENLMKRVRLFLEDGDFSSANEYLDRVLDENAEYAPAYIGKILVKLNLHKADDLSQCLIEFERDSNWQKALRFATPEQKGTYEGYLTQAEAARKEKAFNDAYNKALKALEDAESRDECYRARSQFENIRSYRDSEKLIELCNEKAILMDYNKAISMFNRANTEQECILAAKEMESLGDYKDSKNKAEDFRKHGKYLTYKKAEKMLDSATTDIQCMEAMKVFQSVSDYEDAEEQMKKCRERADEILYYEAKMAFNHSHTIETFEAAKEKFQRVIHVRESAQYIEKCDVKIEEYKSAKYNRALEVMNNAKRPEECYDAASRFRELDGYRDSSSKAKMASEKAIEISDRLAAEKAEAQQRVEKNARREAARKKRNKIIGNLAAIVLVAGALLAYFVIIPQNRYSDAEQAEREGRIKEAKMAFLALGDYKDAHDRAYKLCYEKGIILCEEKKWDEAIAAFELAEGYSDSAAQIMITRYKEGKAKREDKDWQGAIEAFGKAGVYSDATEQIKATYYEAGEAKREEKNWGEAISSFESAGEYKDASAQITATHYQHALALETEGKREEAYKLFISLGEYKDSYERACKPYYDEGVRLLEANDREGAIAVFSKIQGYSDAKAKMQKLAYETAKDYLSQGNLPKAKLFFMKVYDYADSRKQITAINRKGKDLVAATQYDVFGVKSDGTVYASGGGLYTSTHDWKNIVAVSGAQYSCIGLLSNGTVVATGDKSYGKTKNQSWTDIVAVAITTQRSYGVKANGTVVCTTNEKDKYSRTPEIDTWTDIVDIVAATVSSSSIIGSKKVEDTVFGLRKDGTVVGDGVNTRDYSEFDIGDWKDIVELAYNDHVLVGLKSDGTIVIAGSASSYQEKALEWTDIVQVGCGSYGYSDYIVGLKADGTLNMTQDGPSVNGTEWKNINGFSAGDSIISAVRSDGTVVTRAGFQYKGGTSRWALWRTPESCMVENYQGYKESSRDAKYYLSLTSLTRVDADTYKITFDVEKAETDLKSSYSATFDLDVGTPFINEDGSVDEFKKQDDGYYVVFKFGILDGTSKELNLKVSIDVP